MDYVLASSAPLKKTWSRGIEVLETVNDIELGQKGGSVSVDKIMEVSQDIVVKGDLMVMGWVRVEGRMNKDPEEWIEAGGKGPTDTKPMYIKTRKCTLINKCLRVEADHVAFRARYWC